MHRNVRLLLGSSIFIHMGLNILAPVYAIYVQRIGGVAIVGIGFSWTFALMALFATCSALLVLALRMDDSPSHTHE